VVSGFLSPSEHGNLKLDFGGARVDDKKTELLPMLRKRAIHSGKMDWP